MAMEFPKVGDVTVVMPKPETPKFRDYTIDFDNPLHQFDMQHFCIFGFMGTLALFCLCQRLYTKHFLSGGLKADDYLITLAWIFSVVMESVQVWSIAIGGLCHHAWEMPIEVFEKHMLSSYIVAPIFITCNGLSKTSLLTFYLRISPQKWFKTTIWTAMGMVISYTTIIAGLLLFGCSPIKANWDPYTVSGKCVDSATLYIAIAVANIASDVVLFIIPIPTVVGLKMPVAQKVGAGLMFGVGSVTVATSIVRMVYLPSLLSSADVPWVAAPANVWSFVEVNLFIICGSMPTFRKFLKKFAPRFMGTWGSRVTKSNQYELSASRVNRQQRTGYSQFDDVEMNRLSDKGLKGVEITNTAVVGELPRSAGGDSRLAARDDASEEAILDNNRGIACTRTFQVQYSEK